MNRFEWAEGILLGILSHLNICLNDYYLMGDMSTRFAEQTKARPILDVFPQRKDELMRCSCTIWADIKSYPQSYIHTIRLALFYLPRKWWLSAPGLLHLVLT